MLIDDFFSSQFSIKQVDTPSKSKTSSLWPSSVALQLGLCLETRKQIFSKHGLYDMSLLMRKPAFRTWENKDTDQLRDNREADQRLCFRFIDSTIPLLSKSELSNL